MNSKQIAIALLALVGVLAVAEPAMVSSTHLSFKFRVSNSTDLAKGDNGTRLRVRIYDYKDRRREELKGRIIDKGGFTEFIWGFNGCSQTKRREFVIIAYDGVTVGSNTIANGRVRMKTRNNCFSDQNMEFTDFTDVPNDKFKVTKKKNIETLKFHVHVKCRVAGICEI